MGTFYKIHDRYASHFPSYLHNFEAKSNLSKEKDAPQARASTELGSKLSEGVLGITAV